MLDCRNRIDAIKKLYDVQAFKVKDQIQLIRIYIKLLNTVFAMKKIEKPNKLVLIVDIKTDQIKDSMNVLYNERSGFQKWTISFGFSVSTLSQINASTFLPNPGQFNTNNRAHWIENSYP